MVYSPAKSESTEYLEKSGDRRMLHLQTPELQARWGVRVDPGRMRRVA
jgi:hypothetical protein